MSDDLYELHRKECGIEAELIAEVPDLIHFAGFFADYYLGHAVCAAGSRRLYVSVSRRSDNKVVVVNSRTGERGRFQVNTIKHKKSDKYLDCIRGVFAGFESRHIDLCGMDIVLSGDILKACDFILNTAVACGCAVSIVKLLKISMDDGIVASVVYDACCTFAGFHSSYTTVFGMLYAKEGHPILFDNNKRTFQHLTCPFKDSESGIYVIDTGASLEWLNSEIFEISNDLKKASERYSSISQRISFANKTKTELATYGLKMSSKEREYFKYLVSEYFYGISALDIVQNCKFEMMGPYLDKVYRSMKTSLDLTFPECDWWVKRASEIPGCNGAGICFSGDDVYVACVLRKDNFPLLEEKSEEYNRLFGVQCTIKRFLPSDGVKVS